MATKSLFTVKWRNTSRENKKSVLPDWHRHPKRFNLGGRSLGTIAHSQADSNAPGAFPSRGAAEVANTACMWLDSYATNERSEAREAVGVTTN